MYKLLCEYMFLIFLGIYLEVEMLGHMVTVHLIFKKLFIYLAVLDLSYSMWDLVLLTRDGTLAPALGVQSLSHWTTSEVPTCNVLKNCQTVLHNGCAIFFLHSHQQGNDDSSFSICSPILVISVLFFLKYSIQQV